MINWNLLGNPINWLIITLVLILTFYSAFIVAQNAQGFLPVLPKVD